MHTSLIPFTSGLIFGVVAGSFLPLAEHVRMTLTRWRASRSHNDAVKRLREVTKPDDRNQAMKGNGMK